MARAHYNLLSVYLSAIGPVSFGRHSNQSAPLYPSSRLFPFASPPPQLQYAPMLLVALVALASAQRYEPVATKNPITTPSTTTTTITRKTTATTSPTYATTFKRAAVPVRAIADTSKVKRQFPPNPPPNLSPYVGDAFAGPRPSDLLFQYAHTGPDGSVAYGYVYIDCIES